MVQAVEEECSDPSRFTSGLQNKDNKLWGALELLTIPRYRG